MDTLETYQTVYMADMFTFFSLYLNKFGYSLGGYSHWERCSRTR
jgi:hypothetical protein